MVNPEITVKNIYPRSDPLLCDAPYSNRHVRNRSQGHLDLISGGWNTAESWTPNGAPNGPAGIASFALSNTTDVSISEETEVNGVTFTSAATNPYTITTSPGLTLTIKGARIKSGLEITHPLISTGVKLASVLLSQI
jgi:hypothetical protein